MKICISDNLTFLRQKNGYTMEALAEIVSVSRQTVAKWESGDSMPDVTNCVKLATLYKVSIDELITYPIKELKYGSHATDDSKLCGIVNVSEDGAIRLPDAAMDMFDIKKGDKVLLLADKMQGMALIKCSQF